MILKNMENPILFKLAVTVALSASFFVAPVFSEQDLSEQNTSIPHNLRKFTEDDYFSSVIEDKIEEKTQKPTVKNFISFENLPSPSEYESKYVVSKSQENGFENVNLNTSQHFFAPLPEESVVSISTDEEVKEVVSIEPKEQEIVITPELVDSVVSEKLDDIYMAGTEESAEEENVVSSEIDYEGVLISNVNIVGLNTVDSETILSKISTQKGSLYNSAILQKDLQTIYSTGYFTDVMSVEPVENSDKTVDLVFSVEENILVNNVTVVGNSVVENNELSPFLDSLKGKPQNLNKINNAIEGITNYYHEKGFILANVSSVDDTTSGKLIFTIQEGLINKINISGNERTKDYVIYRNIMTQPGTVYNEECLRKDLTKVFSTQIFEEVNRDITPSEENAGTFDVTVVVKEKSTNSVALGGGIDTGLGAFGSISLREDNFLGKAQKVSLSGILGSGILMSDSSIKNHMNYQVELSFFEPYFLNADNSLMSKIYYRELGSWHVPLAIEQRIGFNIGVDHKVKNYENLHTTFLIGAEHINLKEGDFNKISKLYDKYNLNIADRAKQLSDGFFLHLSPGIRYSSLDTEENPREGIIAQARFTESIGVTDFNHTNGRLSGAVTKFFPVFKKSSFSITAKAGAKIHGDEMPEIMAYRLGGPYSIRGYRMNGVGTGESFLMGSAELATPLPWVDKLKWDIFKKMRLTFFVDAGKVFDPTISSVLYDRPEHAITAGIGLRLYIPGIGPMSIDYGIPITNPGKNGSEHGYFTFGSGGLNGMYGYGY